MKGFLIRIFFCWANLEQEEVSKYTLGWINLQRISKMVCPNKEMRNEPVPYTSTNLFMLHEDFFGWFLSVIPFLLVLGTMICRDSDGIQGFLGMLQQTHRSTVGNLLFLIFPRNLREEWEKIRTQKIVDL